MGKHMACRSLRHVLSVHPRRPSRGPLRQARLSFFPLECSNSHASRSNRLSARGPPCGRRGAGCAGSSLGQRPARLHRYPLGSARFGLHPHGRPPGRCGLGRGHAGHASSPSWTPPRASLSSERTEVRVLYDDEALYIGVRLHDSAPVTTRLGRRDMSMEASDWLTVILDSYHDHRTAFGLELNPSGVRRDQTRSEVGEDDSWDPVWEGADHGGLRRLDGGDAHPLQPAALQHRGRADVGDPGGAADRPQGRVLGVRLHPAQRSRAAFPASATWPGCTDVRTGKRLEILPYTRGEGRARGAGRQPVPRGPRVLALRGRGPQVPADLATLRWTPPSTPTSGRWRWTRRR